MKSLSKPQQLQLERLSIINFNDFDGAAVANLLMKNREAWDGFVIGNFEYEVLGELRDIEEHLLADKLYIKTTNEPGNPSRLEIILACLRACGADEIGWIDGTTKEWQGTPGSMGFTRTYEEVRRALCNGFTPKMVIVRAFWD